MVLSDEREPWKRDDVLVSAMSVEWIAKNVFLVAVPSYRRKLSCELTAVDVPRGAALAITDRVQATLARVNNAMRLYLRQDFYSNFPLEGYGDIIFSSESKSDAACTLHWCSLQEALVEAGVACVVRPSVVRQGPLLNAEINAGRTAGQTSKDQPHQALRMEWHSTWLHALHERERSRLCCATRRCVVEDVMRGDVYRVSWLPPAVKDAVENSADEGVEVDSREEDGDGDAVSASCAPLPPLLILHATVCHSPSTQPGYAALRWAQLHLLHRELTVQVHAVYPCDKDVAFNTQLEMYEYLAHARCSAHVTTHDDADADIGTALIAQNLAWVRRVPDAGVPRASNLFALFRTIAASAAKTDLALSPRLSDEAATDHASVGADAAMCAQLGKAWGLPSSSAAALLCFHDPWWRDACWAALQCEGHQRLSGAAALSASSAATSTAAGATAAVWKRFMWCADLHQDPNDEPRVYLHRPLRTLFPLAGLAEWRVRLRGTVDGAVVVHAGGGRRVLQVEINAVVPVTTWRDLRRTHGYADLDAVRFSPAPSDAVLGKKVRVVISASSLGQDVESRLRVCCTSYPANTFSLAQHTPSGVWPIRDGGRCEETLSIDGTAREERVFVLDVVAEGRDEDAMTWTTRGTGRAVYLLSPDVASDAPDTVAEKEEDGGGSGTAAAAAAAAAAETEKQRERTALQPLQHYQSLVSFFFELAPRPVGRNGEAGDAVVDNDGEEQEEEDALLKQLKRVFAGLMYEDVVALPVGVAEVCGVRGLVGDLFFPTEPAPRVAASATGGCVLREDRAQLVFGRSLLTSIGRNWWPSDATRDADASMDANGTTCTCWPMSTSVYAAVQGSFKMCLEQVVEEEWAARQDFLKEVQWHYQVLEQEALNTFATYRPQTPWRMEETAAPVSTATHSCLHFTAGPVTLWRDDSERASSNDNSSVVRLRLPPSLLPPTVPLSLFAVRPRELFSVASSQKMKTTTQRKDAPAPKTLQEKSYDQQDWAFMRLRFPFVPNILRCNWERLPLSLRNTERALCEAAVQDGSFVRQPGMLYTTDRIFSLLLSYLALLQSMQTSGRDGGERAGGGAGSGGSSTAEPSALTSVYAALRQSTPSIFDDCNSAMHFSATLFVLPPFKAPAAAAAAGAGASPSAEAPAKHSRPLFLGSRDNVVADAFEVARRENAAPEVVAFPLLRDLTSHCVAAVALETLVESVEATTEEERSNVTRADAQLPTTHRAALAAGTVVNLDAGRRPDALRTISGQGLPWTLAQASTPVLYHPLPHIAVLASPLVEREEYSADALGRLQLDHNTFDGVKAEPKDAAMVRRRVVLQYRCVNKYDEKNPYKPISYGRISSVDMLKTLIHDRGRGKEVQAYMSLLLRRSAVLNGSEALSMVPDGLLTLHGVPAEPLYVHYRSRADLRFTVSTICPPLRASLLEAEQIATASPAHAAAAVDAAESALFTLYAETAAAYVRKIYRRVRSAQRSAESAEQISLVVTLQPWDDATPPYIAIQIFPVYPADAELTERVLDQERIWQDATTYEHNPHKAFSLLGTRYGRLAMAELRIHYDAAAHGFRSTWNENFESGPVPAATPATA